MTKRKFVYFIFQNGQLDCLCLTRSNALEMAEDPQDHDRSNFRVEQWRLKNKHSLKTKHLGYEFCKTIQAGP